MRRTIAIIIATLALSLAFDGTCRADAYRDSVMNAVLGIEDDSLRLHRMFIAAQNHLDEMWALDLLDSGVADAARQQHTAWELSFMGSKVRWTHRHHDWKRMEQFLREQRKASFEKGTIGNYMSQIAQSVIVLSGVGKYEQAWKYIEQIRRDVREGGAEGEKNRAYIYLAEAPYYQARGESEKCRDTYLRALRTCVNVSPSQRIAIHNGLIEVYTGMEEYEKALVHADSVIAIYYSFSVDHQRVPSSRATLVECEMHKAGLYMRLWEFDKMRECLEKAEENAEGTPPSLYGELYNWWHRYCFYTCQYEKSLEYLDRSIGCLREDHYYEPAMQRRLDKVMSIWAMGKYDEALDYYVATLHQLDTLHQSMIDTQHAYLQQLNEMMEEEEASINMKLWASRIVDIVTFLLFLIIMGAVVYGLYARRTLKSKYNITRDKLEEARQADMAKEQFLHDITTLINDPLQKVVADAKRLVADTSLTPDEQQAMLRENKQHVDRLMVLVNNVLDLSRLEAGMMKYTQTQADLMALLEESANGHNFIHPDSKVEIRSDIDSFPVTIDTGRFQAMLRTLFSTPVDHPEWKPGEISLQLRHGGGNGNAILVIMGTRYSHDDITEAEEMTNRINRIFLSDHGATYAVGYGAITIVFPIPKKQ